MKKPKKKAAKKKAVRKRKPPTKFGPQELRVFDKFKNRIGREVKINVLLAAMRRKSKKKLKTMRDKQQVLGFVVNRINYLLAAKNRHIGPGKGDNTYALLKGRRKKAVRKTKKSRAKSRKK